ncbi:MAG TPA: 30S ribosomal protein S1 [Fibrobacteres bacterium]|jgi:small subunit ribosomal protein S1|nr:30S ribosomal protein S1 [Fibrobacterota bacterium]
MSTKLLYGTEEDLKEFDSEDGRILSDADREQILQQYDATLRGYKEGSIVKGVVVRVTNDDVFVDINFKSEGVIPREEFKDEEELKPGTQIDVYLEQVENQDGQIILSKQRADFMRVWERIREAFEKEEMVQGTITRRIKGGVVVDVFGIEAFLPGSQIDLRQVPDLDTLLGQKMDFKVIKVNKVRRNIVVSRRVVLEQERSKMRDEIIDTLDKGQIREGVVKNITDFGAFIDLGGVDGLLHITDMSWGRVTHPSEVVKLGQRVKVVVLDFNDRKERISLGMKQLTKHPWEDVAAKYPEGTRVKGKVVSITDYGVFVEIAEGVEGLIHISEMSWTQHIKHPSQVVQPGQEIEAVVLKLDPENEKISLGLKQIQPDPWANIENELPVGSKVTGEIRNLAAFGAFIEIKEGVDGLIHVSDMSWTKKINHPSEVFKKGDKVECIVLAIDKEKRRISLSMKHLEDDPWDSVASEFPAGKDVQAKISRLLDRGAVIELANGIEGFIPTSKLTTESIKNPADAFKAGDVVPAVVTEIDVGARKMTLSVVDYFKNKEDAEWKSYLEAHKPRGTTLGDVIKIEGE